MTIALCGASLRVSHSSSSGFRLSLLDRSSVSIVALLVGANMLEYQDGIGGIGGIGPIASKRPGAGKLLMQAVMKAAAEHPACVRSG